MHKVADVTELVRSIDRMSTEIELLDEQRATAQRQLAELLDPPMLYPAVLQLTPPNGTAAKAIAKKKPRNGNALSVRSRLLGIFAARKSGLPLTSKVLMRRIGESGATVSAELSKMSGAGEIKRTGRGKYVKA